MRSTAEASTGITSSGGGATAHCSMSSESFLSAMGKLKNQQTDSEALASSS
jgi:hypothetical protein